MRASHIQLHQSTRSTSMILAGDLGGTKTLLGLFERGERRPRQMSRTSTRPRSSTASPPILDAFARDAGGRLARRCRRDRRRRARSSISSARLTNIAWDVTTPQIERAP